MSLFLNCILNMNFRKKLENETSFIIFEFYLENKKYYLFQIYENYLSFLFFNYLFVFFIYLLILLLNKRLIPFNC